MTRLSVFLTVLVGAVLAFAAPGRAEFVLYLHSFGEWTVICALDEPTRQKRCRLSAPAPVMTAPADGARVRVDIVTDDRDRPQVEVRAQHVIDTTRPLSLRVDDGPAYEVLPPRTGEVAWGGETAAAMVAALVRGRTLVIRFFEPGHEVARERFFALTDFPDALATYRDAVSHYHKAGR